jgi:hypothetical protein
MIQLSPEKFLGSFPDGACLIGPDRRILHVNSRLINTVGSVVGQSCHEALAGLPHVCPFCSFDDLVRGTADPISGASAPEGKTLLVNARLLLRWEAESGDCHDLTERAVARSRSAAELCKLSKKL